MNQEQYEAFLLKSQQTHALGKSNFSKLVNLLIEFLLNCRKSWDS